MKTFLLALLVIAGALLAAKLLPVALVLVGIWISPDIAVQAKNDGS